VGYCIAINSRTPCRRVRLGKLWVAQLVKTNSDFWRVDRRLINVFISVSQHTLRRASLNQSVIYGGLFKDMPTIPAFAWRHWGKPETILLRTADQDYNRQRTWALSVTHTSLLRQYKRNLKRLSSIHSGYNYNKYRHSLLVVGHLGTSH
jgi:hypothetical protein